MQICCTKKLQEQLGIVIQDGIEGNDLFCWSAHLITVKRRKTIVVVNDSNRFGFIFYGLKVRISSILTHSFYRELETVWRMKK